MVIKTKIFNVLKFKFLEKSKICIKCSIKTMKIQNLMVFCEFFLNLAKKSLTNLILFAIL